MTPRVPVQPRVKDAAASKAVAGDPPRASVTLVSSVLVNAEAGMSAATMVPQDGAADTLPVPVWVRNFLVDVVLPARADSVLDAEA